MTNDLVRNCSIVLQDIEILGTAGLGNLLRDGLPAYISVSYVPVCEGPCEIAPKVLVTM